MSDLFIQNQNIRANLNQILIENSSIKSQTFSKIRFSQNENVGTYSDIESETEADTGKDTYLT